MRPGRRRPRWGHVRGRPVEGLISTGPTKEFEGGRSALISAVVALVEQQTPKPVPRSCRPLGGREQRLWSKPLD